MNEPTEPKTFLQKLIWFCLNQKLIVFMGLFLIIGWGIMVAPFKWDLNMPRNPVPVDAIPDIGENQQIVFTKWAGRSPQDVEDQITYPLTVALLGVPEVKTVRSFSMFGFSSIYVVFKEKADFYWSRTRILEKLNSLAPGTLPEGVNPTLGPDATALGQIFWYTLEGLDDKGNPTGGWNLDELRTAQDWQVRYALLSADGVSEVASIGGFVKEYQVDVDPDALTHYGIKLEDVLMAVKMSNQDIGAKTIEVNRVEYVIRGIGFVKSLHDIENAVIKTIDNTPIYVKQVATLSEGPALRRGVLDKGGAEAVGGVVIARFGANPLQVIDNVKQKMKAIEAGLPEKVLPDGTKSKLSIVPFYDRSGLIHETLDTLNKALYEEILITIIVVLLLIMNFRSSLLISVMLPLSVLMVFIAMKQFGVDANIVALSGIAIAIGTIVDMGIVMTENIVKRLGEAGPDEPRLKVIYKASVEVGSAVLTAVLTTIISFLPVFTMTGAEGKLFNPLAFTKTFALTSSILIALILLPPIAHLFFDKKVSLPNWAKPTWERLNGHSRKINIGLIVLMGILLSKSWMPLGVAKPLLFNIVFVFFLIGSVLGSIAFFQHVYPTVLAWCLENKQKFLAIPATILVIGGLIWANLGKEFMPALDEGGFLYMPTTMTHASITEATDVLQKQDIAFSQIPEIESVVGKLGRADTALDPAPISMIETIINYKPEYSINEKGERVRNWRPHINSPNDIWKEIQKAAQLPGSTSAPKLQPIEARLVMLQSGVRAPMAIKVKGPDLKTIERFGMELEHLLKTVPNVESDAVFADRVVGKPYYEIHINRDEIARHGIMLNKVQQAIMIAIGGMDVTQTVEGRERYNIRVRYQRELRDSLEALNMIRVDSPKGYQVPLTQLADIQYVRGPQVIKSEDTFLTSYVIFDKKPQVSEMEAVSQAQKTIRDGIESGKLSVPNGVSFEFTGNYENLVRSEKTLKIVLPLALVLIFMVLYLQFSSLSLTSLVFSGILIAWSGGFLMLWLYGQGWFMNLPFIGEFLRDIFQIHPINLSVAVWVGFLALFGIASDDGVMMGTFLKQSFEANEPTTIQDIRNAVLEAGKRRIRPCLMTTATTILALLPVLTSQGRGADIMVPMAIPSFGGMFVAIITLVTVPVLYSSIKEKELIKQQKKEGGAA
jgi:Cu(I)/Ag(I) efflux system membrane protein CusA/SilA